MKKFWQIATFALILILTACGAPGIPFLAPAPTPTATPLPLPPTVAETVPQVGSELGLKATLLVFFSEPMDRASVEAALTSDFTGGILFSWVDDVTLGLTPQTAYPSDGRITFTLAASAKSAGGLALPEPLTFSYKTAAPLRVAQVLPADRAVDVSPDSAVVVAFNQPVVALGADASALPAGLTLEPAAQGKGEWVNTSTYIFHPETALAGGVNYIARVNPQLNATSGAALDANGQNVTWTFGTSLPRLLEVTPKNTGGPLPLDPQLALTFNQPMDRASVGSNFIFSGPNGRLTGTFTWNDKSTVATFKPSTLLERDAAYTLTLSGQARSRGGAALGSDTSISYQSVPPFGVSGTSFPSGITRPLDKRDVSMIFSAPLAEYKNSELTALITVSPSAAISRSINLDGQTVQVRNIYTPGQSYSITFSGNLKDRWGQALGKDYVFTFREPDAQPSISLGPSYNFPVLFARPEALLVGAQVVNVKQLHIALGSFTLADFFRYQSDYNYRNAYSPNEMASWNEQTDLALNQNAPYTIDLSRKGQALATGLYYVAISSREITRPYPAALPLLVSNVNLTLKTNVSQAFVWAVDLRTHTPVANAVVTLYDEKGKPQASGATDANGIWQGSFLRKGIYDYKVYAVLGQPGDDMFGMAAQNWNSEIDPWSFHLNFDGGDPQSTVYIYTERPVYRPGDTVHYRGILRRRFDGRYTDANISDLSVSMNGPNGKTTQSVSLSAYGSFNGEFTLSANAIPGSYNLDGGGKSVYFQVADYRKPEINLSATLLPDPATNGQAITGKVDAAYFFGAPVGDLPFEWRIYQQRSYFEIPGYSTGLYRTDWYSNSAGSFGGVVAEGKARTGADGSFNIPLDAITVDEAAKLTLEITASESGGFPVSARAALNIHPADFYAGIRPDAWFGRAGNAAGFSILTAGLDNKALPNKMLLATFERVTWERTDLMNGYSFTPNYTPVESQQITTDADGKAHVIFTPAQTGTYMLEVAGNGAKSQALIWVGGAQNALWPNLPAQRMELTANQTTYKPGETASIYIPSSFSAPAPALVTTERSSVLTSQVISVPPEGYTFNLPLGDDQAPNTYVSVTMLGPGADFRQGYINLPVEPVAFKLNVALKATPEKAKPGDKLTLDLTVTDSNGQPAQAEFSLAVVDLAALALAEPNSQQIVPAYYSTQPLGIFTGLTDAVYARRVLPGFVGGTGGGGDGAALVIREKFPDTAYWKADIVTDAQGKAQITLTLPDSLTTWQVDTRGLTKDTKVGQALVRVVTGKELMIRPQTPRFLVVGDHAELAAMVNNATTSTLNATVSLQVKGFSLDDPATAQQKVQVPANGRIRVAWSGVAQAGDSVDPIFTVKSDSLEDASRPNDGNIPVLHYSAPQTFNTGGILSDAAVRHEIIAIPKTFQPLGGKLDLELSPSLAAVILDAIKADKALPEDLNWNNERLASDFLAKLATYQTLKAAGLSTDPLSASVLDDVRRLLVNQNQTDHGWAWTVGGAESDPYLTAYILFALNQAAQAKLGVDLNDAIQNAYNYLVAAPPFDKDTDLTQPWALNRAVFANYVLQQVKSANLDTLDTIYASRDKLDPWARALLAETLRLVSPGDERANTLLSDLQSSAIRSASGAHWESVAGDGHNPNSPLLTTAMVVYILAQRDPSTPLLADAARYLAAQRGASPRWGSSYETTWVILALDQYMKASGELQGNFKFSAMLNDSPFATGEAATQLDTVTASAPLSQMSLSNANSLVISRDAGAGKLYYRAALTVDRPVESATPLNQGIGVSRQFLACNGADCQPVTSYQMPADVSGRVKVELTITLPHDAYYLMVQDAIPAGADILDSSLKTSQQGQPDQSVAQVTPTPQGPQYDNADPFGEGWGWWYFNTPQIYSDHILWSADYLPAGTYVITYTIVPSLPGQYRVLPAHAWEAYFPEVQGTSAGSVFEITRGK
jgi:hypothetical protein